MPELDDEFPHKVPQSAVSAEVQADLQVAHRLAVIRRLFDATQPQMAASLGVSRSAYQSYERGARMLRASELTALAGMGCNIHWLLTGDGDMLIGGGAEQPPTAAPGAPSKTVAEQGVMALDAELMGRVVDAIRAVYKAQGQGLPDRTLGEIAARWYGDIAAVSADPGDRLDALAERQIGLRRELRDAATNAASGKQHRA